MIAMGLLACATGTGAGPDASVVEATTEAGLFELRATFDPPPTVGATSALLEVERAGGPVTEAEVALDAWMPTHGHGLADPPEVTELGDGAYAADWVFPMPGAWELTVTVAADEGTDEAVIDVDVE